MKLFVIYIGGSTESSLIELHDIRFVVASSIEKTYDVLRSTWWGKPKSLHLDAWAELTYADGYDIAIYPINKSAMSLSKNNSNSQEKLYFVNLGGYDCKQFTELHHNAFVVAKDKKTAKIKAKTQIKHWEVPHVDNTFEIESIISVGEYVKNLGYNVILNKSKTVKEFSFTCKYIPIGIK